MVDRHDAPKRAAALDYSHVLAMFGFGKRESTQGIDTGIVLDTAAVPTDRAHVISKMTDTAAADDAKCQSSGAKLGSPAYKECRALLEAKMSIEKDVPPTLGYARTRDGN